MSKPKYQNTLALVTEKVWRQQVIGLASVHKWTYYFTWTSLHSPAGFPDLVLVRPPRIIFAELKTEKGKLTLDQMTWLEKLHESGQEVHVWRPHDWDEIAKLLK